MTKTALYRFFGADGELLYIGITKNFGRRWNSHAKSKPWWDEVHSHTAVWFPEREEAAAAEKQAIRSEHPKYNSMNTRRWERYTKPPLEPKIDPDSGLPLPMPGFLTADEVVARLGTDEWTFRVAIQKGHFLPPDRRSSHKSEPVWTLALVEAWEKENPVPPWVAEPYLEPWSRRRKKP